MHNNKKTMDPGAAPFSPVAGAVAGGGGGIGNASAAPYQPNNQPRSNNYINGPGNGPNTTGNAWGSTNNTNAGGHQHFRSNNTMMHSGGGDNYGNNYGGGGNNFNNSNQYNNNNAPPHARNIPPPNHSNTFSGSHQPHMGGMNSNQYGGGGGGGAGGPHQQHYGGQMNNNQYNNQYSNNNQNFGGNTGGPNAGGNYNANNNMMVAGGIQNQMGGASKGPGNQQQNVSALSVAPTNKGSVPPVVLLVDADDLERKAIAAYLANEHKYHHIALDDTAGEATVHYKEFRQSLQDHLALIKSDPNAAKCGLVVEVKLTYHFVEFYYIFEEMRSAKIYPTHIVYVDHPVLANIPHSGDYDYEQRTHHPLAFESCQLLFQELNGFIMIDEAFPAEPEARKKSAAMKQLLDGIDTPQAPLMKLTADPNGVFSFLALHPDVKVLTTMTDRLLNIFGSSDLYAKPAYALDYAAVSRNSYQLPHYYSTIDLNGIDTVIAKVGEQFLVFFPKYIALATLDPAMVPEGLREMVAAPGSAGCENSAEEAATNATDAKEKKPAASPSDIAWVINATICYDDASKSCTIYAKDIILANGNVVANQSFAARHKLLCEAVPESPASKSVIIVRQRYYPALETSSILKKLEDSVGGSNNTALTGNGLWFINPGKAQLTSSSSWNYKYALAEGGFDARLWNASQEEGSGGKWTFEIHCTTTEGEEQAIGSIVIENEIVEEDGLNDGQIVRVLMKKELPVAEAPAPQPKKGGKNAKAAPVPQQQQQPQEPCYVFSYIARQHWTFVPTNEDPRNKRFGKKDLLDALEALK